MNFGAPEVGIYFSIAVFVMEYGYGIGVRFNIPESIFGGFSFCGEKTERMDFSGRM